MSDSYIEFFKAFFYGIFSNYIIVLFIIFVLSYIVTREINKVFNIVGLVIKLEFSRFSGYSSVALTLIFIFLFALCRVENFYCKVNKLQPDHYEIWYFLGALAVTLSNFGLMYLTRPKE